MYALLFVLNCVVCCQVQPSKVSVLVVSFNNRLSIVLHREAILPILLTSEITLYQAMDVSGHWLFSGISASTCSACWLGLK